MLKKDNLDLNVFKNYGPVSNIPFISKVLEKVAVKRLTNHLDINGLQEDYQSDYKLMHSTETALLKVKHDSSSALDKLLHKRKHGVKHHKYAVDVQLYVEYEPAVPGAREKTIRKLEACIKEIRIWMSLRMLIKFNDDTTEMVIFCYKHHLGQYGYCTINIGDSAIIPVSHFRNLRVEMDQHLSMINQITAICAACNFSIIYIQAVVSPPLPDC